MRIWAGVAWALALSACGTGGGDVLVRTELQRCPDRVPAVACPQVPALRPRPAVEELERTYLDAMRALDQCGRAVDVLVRAITECGEQAE